MQQFTSLAVTCLVPFTWSRRWMLYTLVSTCVNPDPTPPFLYLQETGKCRHNQTFMELVGASQMFLFHSHEAILEVAFEFSWFTSLDLPMLNWTAAEDTHPVGSHRWLMLPAHPERMCCLSSSGCPWIVWRCCSPEWHMPRCTRTDQKLFRQLLVWQYLHNYQYLVGPPLAILNFVQ